MSAVGCEIKLFNVIIEVVLFEKGLQFLLGGKFDPAGAVYVNVPSARLLSVLPTFQLTNPTRGQSLVLELEHFGQMGGTPPYFDPITAAATVVVTPTPTHTHCRGGSRYSRCSGVSSDPRGCRSHLLSCMIAVVMNCAVLVGGGGCRPLVVIIVSAH